MGQWGGGFQAEVKVTAGRSAIKRWTVTRTFADGRSVTDAWNATVSGSGASVTARDMSYNGSLGAGAGTTFGLLGSRNGGNSVPSLSCTASRPDEQCGPGAACARPAAVWWGMGPTT
ncbi:cellulose binding domain-containing protein [Microbispora sp. ZYX-F-249]|uniref:Cellulose binding domain-containing protein n=1 Tax=Microbispora maris TaxID=3144104 RepID=A0ABV0AM03_9ACTN